MELNSLIMNADRLNKSYVTSMALTILFVLLDVFLVSGYTFSEKQYLDKQIRSEKKICERWGEIFVNNNSYLVRNNIWNDKAGEQCITINLDKPVFQVISTNHPSNSQGVPASYPSIIKGCHPWGSPCTSGWSSQKLQNIQKINSNWVLEGTNAKGQWNATYELWINPSTDTKGPPSGTELMIWLKSNGGIVPGGLKVGTTKLREKIKGQWQPIEYDVYHASPWSKWQHYVAYQRRTPTEQVEINLKDALDDCVSRDWCEPQWHLVAIEAGFEIWQGGIGLKIVDFSASIDVK
ncbi:MAG TPA: hypothetical protein DCF68_15855 [Cyanothece sp. UBA12306]|nr:hypothetical protein [Cyanothece sp. UBA12306]